MTRSDLDQALHSARRVRFLCSGNVVRSAFAELYARMLGCPLPVDSAATTFQNSTIFPETRAALLERGLEPGALEAFRPRHLSRFEEEGALEGSGLLVFGMGREHLDAWQLQRPGAGPAFLLSELLGRRRRIADPVLDGASFEDTFATVERCVERLIERLSVPGEGPG